MTIKLASSRVFFFFFFFFYGAISLQCVCGVGWEGVCVYVCARRGEGGVGEVGMQWPFKFPAGPQIIAWLSAHRLSCIKLLTFTIFWADSAEDKVMCFFVFPRKLDFTFHVNFLLDFLTVFRRLHILDKHLSVLVYLYQHVLQRRF